MERFYNDYDSRRTIMHYLKRKSMPHRSEPAVCWICTDDPFIEYLKTYDMFPCIVSMMNKLIVSIGLRNLSITQTSKPLKIP